MTEHVNTFFISNSIVSSVVVKLLYLSCYNSFILLSFYSEKSMQIVTSILLSISSGYSSFEISITFYFYLVFQFAFLFQFRFRFCSFTIVFILRNRLVSV